MLEHGFVRVAAASPKVHLAEPMANAKEIFKLVEQAAGNGTAVVVTPELSLTGYSLGDLHHQPLLLSSALEALNVFCDHLQKIDSNKAPVVVISMPLTIDDSVFICAVVCDRTGPLAVIPKSYLPNYREQVSRWFAPASQLRSKEILLCGRQVPVGTDILVDIIPNGQQSQRFTLGVEICEDVFMPIQPGALAALAGASIIANVSASPELVGKARYRKELVTNASARYICGYVYAASGMTESTRDVVFSGHNIIAEYGRILNVSARFSTRSQITYADIDVQRLKRERSVVTSFGANCAAQSQQYRRIEAAISLPEMGLGLLRPNPKHPFVPSDPTHRRENCEEVFRIASAGLQRRLLAMGGGNPVDIHIGVSGGRDSTLALLIALNAVKALGWSRSAIKARTMPGFGTTERTVRNAHELCDAMRIEIKEKSIVKAAEELLLAEDHEPCKKPGCTMCENAQARTRQSVLLGLGFTLGTGSLSESALGWCTYGGDHLPNYNVNAGIPKTLIDFVIETVIEMKLVGEAANNVLRDILDTEMSPELLPPTEDGQISQKTEDILGPYELHDYFLFHAIRNGADPRKLLFLATNAFGHDYPITDVLHVMKVFFGRFFQNQHKRNASSDGPKIGTVSLSPRADWRMPSEGVGKLWLAEIEEMT